MMNSSQYFFLCCLFTVAFFFFSHHTSSSVDVIPKPVRKLSMSIPAVNHEYHKIKVEDEAIDQYASNSNSSSHHDLVYHVDYNGVATHPTPKHPKNHKLKL